MQGDLLSHISVLSTYNNLNDHVHESEKALFRSRFCAFLGTFQHSLMLSFHPLVIFLHLGLQQWLLDSTISTPSFCRGMVCQRGLIKIIIIIWCTYEWTKLWKAHPPVIYITNRHRNFLPPNCKKITRFKFKGGYKSNILCHARFCCALRGSPVDCVFSWVTGMLS